MMVGLAAGDVSEAAFSAWLAEHCTANEEG